MRETDYVELAFWAGWCEAQGVTLSVDDMCEMAESLKDAASQLAQEYVDNLEDK